MQMTEATPQGTLTLQTIAMPADTNANGDIFGGWLMAQMDLSLVRSGAGPSSGAGRHRGGRGDDVPPAGARR